METTLTAAQAVAIAKAIGPAVSSDKQRPNLMAVRVTATDTGGELSATDGYVAVWLTVPELSGFPATSLDGPSRVAALKAAAKAAGRRGSVTVAGGDTFTVSAAGMSAAVPVRDGFADGIDKLREEAYRRVGSGDTGDTVPGFSPERLGDVLGACAAVAEGTQAPARLVHVHSKLAGVIECRGPVLSLVALVMPQRVAH